MILNIISLITNELGLVRYLLIVCYDLLIPFILKVLSFSYWFAKVSYTISISVPCWLEALQVFGHLSVNLSLCRTEVLNFDISFFSGGQGGGPMVWEFEVSQQSFPGTCMPGAGWAQGVLKWMRHNPFPQRAPGPVGSRHRIPTECDM